MSEPVNEPQVVDQGFSYLKDQGQQQDAPQAQPEELKLNPAWNELLGQLPSNYHQAITPHLKKWDQNYNDGIQKVHSQYEAWKPFVENQVQPDEVNNALLVWQSMNDDPTKFIETLMDYYKYTPQGGQGQNPQQPQLQTGEEDEGIPFDVTQHPEFQRLQQIVETLGQANLQQYEQQVEVQMEQEVAQMFADAKQRHGEFDEAYVAQLLMINEGMSIDDAVAAYQSHVQGIIQNYRSPGQQAPVLMGGGGGVPSSATRASGMSGKDRRALIVQTLLNGEQK